MHNNENDPLSLPVVGRDALVMGENKLLVAATVAAVVLAGSALVYRHAANASSKDRPQKGWLLTESSTLESHPDVNKQGGGAIDSNAGLAAAPTSTAAHTPGQDVDISVGTNNAQIKSPRSKDRRRRGKDPLKEALKNGKKLRTMATTNPPPNPAPGFKEEPFVSAGPSTSFQPLDSDSSQSAIPPEAPSSQQGPSQRRQRFESFETPDTDTTTSCVSGHSSEASRSIPDAEGDEVPVAAGFDQGPFHSDYKPFSPQSQSSLTQTSDSSARSSVTDGSELDPESEGWITSGSKSRSRSRTYLADVLFEDPSVGTSGIKVDQGEEGASSARKGLSPKEHENTAADSSSLTPVPTVNPMKGLWHDVESVDVETELHPSPLPLSVFGSKAMSNSNLHVFPSSDDPSSAVRNKNNSQTQQQEPSPWDWDGTSTTPVSNTLDDSIDEILNIENGDEDDEMTPVSIPRTKCARGRTNFSSFSSALVEGGGGLGACRTVGVSIAGPPSSPSAGTIEVDGSASSFGEDKEEFTFPTLNDLPSPIAGGPNRTRSTSNYDAVNSSPSKKSRKGGKNNVLPSNPASSTSPSKSTFHRETRYNTGHGNPSNLDGVIAAQTQLASLKGALEAARQREEKHKEDMEKAMKDMEVLKWEGTNSRRGEAELQAQVRHLTDQLQSYATLFATMAPHLAPHIAAAQYLHQTRPRPQMKADENTDSLSDPESNPKVDRHSPQSLNADVSASDRPPIPQTEEVEAEKGAPEDSVSSLTADNEPVPSTPSQGQFQQTPALSPPPPQLNGVASPLHASGHLLSPPPSAAVPSTFFPYGMSPYAHVIHPHLPVQPFTWVPYQRQQVQAHGTPQSPNQPPFPSIFPPMMYPMSPVPSPLTHHYSYGHGSAGTSSAGSYSPELSGSPRLGMNGKNRPSRMKKNKTNVMNNGSARPSWEDVGDAYIGLNGIVTSSSDASGGRKGKNQTLEIPTSAEFEVDDDGESSSPYSDLLADAILKRPSSIRSPSVGPPLQKDARKTDGALFEDQKRDKSEEQQCAEGMEQQLTEFTFPSLSDFGGGSYYRAAASRTESSISSSLSSSPPSTTTTIPESIGDQKGEELAPVIENDNLYMSSSVGVLEGNTVKKKNKVDELSTPTQDMMVTTPS